MTKANGHAPLEGIEWSARKIALVGLARSTRHLAPFDDPAWSIWGMANAHKVITGRWNVWWEMHHRAAIDAEPSYTAADHEFFRTARVPIYTLEAQPDWPSSISYPIEEVERAFPRAAFGSTVCYMLGLALLLIRAGKMLPTIGLWGIDLSAASEYGPARLGAHWWLGVAAGMGVEIVIPEHSALLARPARYGYDDVAAAARRSHLTARLEEVERTQATLERETREAHELAQRLQGHAEELRYQIAHWTMDDDPDAAARTAEPAVASSPLPVGVAAMPAATDAARFR